LIIGICGIARSKDKIKSARVMPGINSFAEIKIKLTIILFRFKSITEEPEGVIPSLPSLNKLSFLLSVLHIKSFERF